MKRLGVAAALVDGQVVPGDVGVEDGEITALGLPGGGAGIAAPGFVDVQVNGFGGVDLSASGIDLDGYRTASAAMARTGVTSFLATFPTASTERYDEVLPVAAAAVEAELPGAGAVGVHLEGPFLSRARAGAHNPAWLRRPDAALLRHLLALAPVRVVTLAPELDGALDLVRSLVAAGIAVAVGHSDSSGPEVDAAFDAGAVAVTHLWNAQRVATAREPGVVGTALARDDVWVCVIADLVHVSPPVLQVSLRAAGGRAVVVTDAVAPAGLAGAPPVARLADGTMAGSTSTLDASVRNLVGLGIGLTDALAMVSARPAALLRRPDLGRLAVGGRADVTVLGDDLRVREVLVAGRSRL